MMQIEEIAKVCDGLAHPIRVRIYELLLKQKGEWVRVTDLFKVIQEEFGVSSRQTILNHLKTMLISDLIEMEKKGKEFYVRLKYKIDVKKEPIVVVA